MALDHFRACGPGSNRLLNPWHWYNNWMQWPDLSSPFFWHTFISHCQAICLLRICTGVTSRQMKRCQCIIGKGKHDRDAASQPYSQGWDAVGGLNDVVQQLKEMVLLPLLYPEIFSAMHLQPPRYFWPLPAVCPDANMEWYVHFFGYLTSPVCAAETQTPNPGKSNVQPIVPWL